LNYFVSQSAILQKVLNVFLALIIFVCILAASYLFLSQPDDSYTKLVLSLPGERSRGEMIFKINCAACHGFQADGMVGPSLRNVSKRKSRRGLIQQVTSGKTPPMPKFKPKPQEMADLLSFLEYI